MARKTRYKIKEDLEGNDVEVLPGWCKTSVMESDDGGRKLGWLTFAGLRGRDFGFTGQQPRNPREHHTL